MGCDCAQTAFNEYFTEEVERLTKQITEFPETFRDLWSDLALSQQDNVAEEVLAGMAQGVLDSPGLDALVGFVKEEVGAAIGPAQMPQFESALDELSRVKDTQSAIKVLASIVFIVSSDSIFNVLNTLARKILRLSALKLSTLARIRVALRLAVAAATAFEAAGVDSQEIRNLILSAAGDVSAAEALVSTMTVRARGGTEVRRTTVVRAQVALQSAIDKLAVDSVDSELLQSGALAALFASSDPLAVATSGMLLASMYIKELRELAKQLDSQNRQISAALLAFKVGMSKRQTATLTDYQYTVLREIQKRLSAARGSMVFAANSGSMQDIAIGVPSWLTSLAVAKQMLERLPPEVRQQEDLNAELLAAYTEAVRALGSIDGSHIADGVENAADLVAALGRIIYQMENLFGQVDVGALADNARYLSTSSTITGFTPIAFVSSELVEGAPRFHWVVAGASVVTESAVPASVPAMARIDESLIQATLVVDVMTTYLEVQPPSTAAVEALLDLLKLLRMDRGRDLLAAGNISDFMDSAPLNWSYLGSAIDCIQRGMAAALDAGQSEIYDQLDTLLEPMSSKMAAVQIRMQRQSSYSLATVLEKLEIQVDQLEAVKETLFGIMDKVDC